MKNIPNDQIFCKCGAEMTLIDHTEYDGTPQGSYEPYWECIEGCPQEEL